MSVFTLTVTQVKPRFPSKIVYTEKITEERAHVFAQLEVIWCQDGSQLIPSVDVDPTAAPSVDDPDTTGSAKVPGILGSMQPRWSYRWHTLMRDASALGGPSLQLTSWGLKIPESEGAPPS